MKLKFTRTCMVFLLFATSEAAERSASGEKEDARFKKAFQIIEASNKTEELVRAMATLRQGFPKSRQVIVEALKTGAPKVKCFALNVLGEYGEASRDLDVVAPLLKDEKQKVRLSAGMAIRRLGKDGYKALCEYLPGETDPNNRKMAYKTFQDWRMKEAIPLLVEMMAKEKDRFALNFAVTALEVLSGMKFGKNVEAWQSYREAQAMQEQAKAIVQPVANSDGGAKK